MRSLTGYHRALSLLMALALVAIGVASYQAVAGSGVVGPAPFVLLGLGIGAGLAWRGRLWRPMALLTSASAAGTIVYLGLVPWWVGVGAGLGALAFAALIPAMWRRDRIATVVATLLSVGLGAQSAWLVSDALAAPDQARRLSRSAIFPTAAPVPPPPVTDAYERGLDEAYRDLRQGKRKLLTFGYPAAWRPVYGQILAREGIALEAIAGCVVSNEEVDYVRGYNEVMEKDVAAELGEHFLRTARRNAQASLHFGVY